MSLKRLNQADQLTLRIENFADLASLLGSGSFEGRHIPEPLEDFMEYAYQNAKSGEDDMSLLCRLFLHNDPDRDRAEDEFIDAEELAFQLLRHRLTGVLLNVATPVKNFYKPDAGSYSWAHYHTRWVYGSTFDKAWASAMVWAKEATERDKALSLTKKGGTA